MEIVRKTIAEQILEKHLLLMIKRIDQSYVSVDEMKQQPEWQATINAMLEYGEMQNEELVCSCKTDPQFRECTNFKCVRFIEGV